MVDVLVGKYTVGVGETFGFGFVGESASISFNEQTGEPQINVQVVCGGAALQGTFSESGGFTLAAGEGYILGFGAGVTGFAGFQYNTQNGYGFTTYVAANGDNGTNVVVSGTVNFRGIAEALSGPPNSNSGPPGWDKTYSAPWASTAYYNQVYGLPNTAQTANDPFKSGSTIPIPYLDQYMQLNSGFFSNNPAPELPAPDINSFTLPGGSFLPSNQTPPEGWVPNSTVLDPSEVPPQPVQYMDQYTAGIHQLDAGQMPQ